MEGKTLGQQLGRQERPSIGVRYKIGTPHAAAVYITNIYLCNKYTYLYQCGPQMVWYMIASSLRLSTRRQQKTSTGKGFVGLCK